MHSFQWVQGALGIITGLGMTRIAVSTVNCVIARTQVKLDWIPFAWAACIFILLLQFSWNLVALEAIVPVWRFSTFLSLLLFIFNLFLAAALILPNSESQAGSDLTTWYQSHGRWAMPFVIAYVMLAYPFNWVFMHDSPLNNPASAIISCISLTALFTKRRKILVGATLLMVLVSSAILAQMITSDV